jgi:hypothetical protein
VLAGARCIIPIEYFPPSLSAPAWTSPFHRDSFLMHCARSLGRMAPYPILIVTPACTSQIIREHLKTLPFESLLTVAVRVLPAIREAAQHLGLIRILAVHCAFGAGLLPDSALAELADLHAREQPDITVADGLPAPLYAHLYEMAALDALSELRRC